MTKRFQVEVWCPLEKKKLASYDVFAPCQEMAIKCAEESPNFKKEFYNTEPLILVAEEVRN